MTTNRQCGTCHACCIHVPVQDLNKLAGVPCPHLVNKGSKCCSIYESRPSGCAVYQCAWLDGNFPTGMRPEKSGLLLETSWIEYPRKLTILAGFETRPGALEPAKRRLLDSLPEGCVASIVFHDRSGAELLGREEDCRTFVEFMERCRADGRVIQRMADGDRVIGLGEELVQLDTVLQGG
jgi:Fe-S-cluster containining protein